MVYEVYMGIPPKKLLPFATMTSFFLFLGLMLWAEYKHIGLFPTFLGESLEQRARRKKRMKPV